LRVTIRRGNRLISQERRVILEGGRTHETRFQFGVVAPGDRVAESAVTEGTLTNSTTLAASDELLRIEE
jgi:hypothetical protein